jgi:hypothetical protein
VKTLTIRLSEIEFDMLLKIVKKMSASRSYQEVIVGLIRQACSP